MMKILLFCLQHYSYNFQKKTGILLKAVIIPFPLTFRTTCKLLLYLERLNGEFFPLFKVNIQLFYILIKYYQQWDLMTKYRHMDSSVFHLQKCPSQHRLHWRCCIDIIGSTHLDSKIVFDNYDILSAFPKERIWKTINLRSRSAHVVQHSISYIIVLRAQALYTDTLVWINDYCDI